jgi:hypothetical protein
LETTKEELQSANEELTTVNEQYRLRNSSLVRNLHPPIDRILLQGLASSTKIRSPHKAEWRSINWTELDESAYERLIRQLRDAIPKEVPFWMIEEYWEPSDSGEDAL